MYFIAWQTSRFTPASQKQYHHQNQRRLRLGCHVYKILRCHKMGCLQSWDTALITNRNELFADQSHDVLRYFGWTQTQKDSADMCRRRKVYFVLILCIFPCFYHRMAYYGLCQIVGDQLCPNLLLDKFCLVWVKTVKANGISHQPPLQVGGWRGPPKGPLLLARLKGGCRKRFYWLPLKSGSFTIFFSWLFWLFCDIFLNRLFCQIAYCCHIVPSCPECFVPFVLQIRMPIIDH